VVEKVLAARVEPLIVTADEAVSDYARSAGLQVLSDTDTGLDEACQIGVAASPGRWVVLHADLPLLDVGDVSVLREAVASGRDVIAPSSDGGTSAISSTDAVLFSFGAASFHRHLPRLTDPVIVARVGLLHDLDSDKDLRSALRHPKGHWLRPFVEGWSDLVGDSSRTFPR
jgi:2-phospho-L-lactate guanylyltransferase (CobY/MobA/RfbA family)